MFVIKQGSIGHASSDRTVNCSSVRVCVCVCVRVCVRACVRLCVYTSVLPLQSQFNEPNDRLSFDCGVLTNVSEIVFLFRSLVNV